MSKQNQPIGKPQQAPSEIKGRITPAAPRPQVESIVKKGEEKLGRIMPAPPKPNK